MITAYTIGDDSVLEYTGNMQILCYLSPAVPEIMTISASGGRGVAEFVNDNY